MPPSREKDKPSTNEDSKRGPTICKKVIRKRYKAERFDLSWTVKGLPYGDNRQKLSSFIGVCARRRVPITYDSWDKVPKDIKDLIWDDVVTVFDIPQLRRKWMLQRAGERWKEFKCRLRRLFTSNEDGTIRTKPPPQYDFITPAQWNIFLKKLASEDFQQKSATYRSRSKNNKCRPKCSRKGYVGIEEEMLKEQNLDPRTSKVNRDLLWKRARMNKDGNVEEDTQEVIEWIDSLVSQGSKGLVTEVGCVDVSPLLSEKKDHPAHPIATGPNITIKAIFAPAPASDPDIAQMRKMVDELVLKVNALESKHHNKELQEVQEAIPACSAQASCSAALFSCLPPGSIKCKLMLDNPRRVVAHGEVIIPKTDEPEFINNVPLDPTCKKVRVFTAVENMKSSEVPFPNKQAEVFLVKDAPDNILAWPMELIDMEHVPVSPATKSKASPCKSSKGKMSANSVEDANQVKSGNTSAPVIIAVAISPSPNLTAATNSGLERKRLAKLKMLNFYAVTEMVAGDTIMIQSQKEVVGYTKPVSITGDEIIKWFEQKKVELSQMSIYIKSLFDKTRIVGDDNLFEFICPRYISPGNVHDDEERMHHLSATFERGKDQSVFLVPCCVSEHWILCVIDPKWHICYWLDPLRGPVCADVKDVVEKALKVFQSKNGDSRKPRKNVKWVKIKCPKQPNGIDSGYYVMRFMKEIIEKRQRLFQQSIFANTRVEPTNKLKLMMSERSGRVMF